MPFLQQLHASFGVSRSLVESLVKRATGHAAEGLERLAEGYDNEVYRATLAAGVVVYVRVSRAGPQDVADEAWAMGLARDAGVPVPDVLAVEAVEATTSERGAMVVAAAAGTSLGVVAGRLDPAERRQAMTHLGEVVRLLHTVSMPGVWRPDRGVWPDRNALLAGFLADRIAEVIGPLGSVLPAAWAGQVLAVLRGTPDLLGVGEPVLCHGDLKPEHVFVDADQRVVGLIDWGMWAGSTPLVEWAGCLHDLGETDLTEVAQVIGHLAHHHVIGDEVGVQRNLQVLRAALAEL